MVLFIHCGTVATGINAQINKWERVWKHSRTLRLVFLVAQKLFIQSMSCNSGQYQIPYFKFNTMYIYQFINILKKLTLIK